MLIVTPIVGFCNYSMLCCALHNVHSSFQSSWWGREYWLLYFVCFSGVSWLLCGSSSRCHSFVCSLWLWYFLIILSDCFVKKPYIFVIFQEWGWSGTPVPPSGNAQGISSCVITTFDLYYLTLPSLIYTALYHPYQLQHKISRDVQCPHWCMWYKIVIPCLSTCT